jgi:hypothetical protein
MEGLTDKQVVCVFEAYTSSLKGPDNTCAMQEGTGAAVMSGYVEVVFDNSDGRFPVSAAFTPLTSFNPGFHWLPIPVSQHFFLEIVCMYLHVKSWSCGRFSVAPISACRLTRTKSG